MDAFEAMQAGRAPITQWVCSQRCWAEGGPHDETCHPLTNATRAPIAVTPAGDSMPQLLCAHCEGELDLADVWQLHPDNDHPSLKLCCSEQCAHAISQTEHSTNSTPNAGVRDD